MINKFLSENKDNFYLVFRLLVGLLFAMHGATKFGIIGGQANLSGLFLIAAIIELFGGILIFLGAFVNITAVFCGLEMIVAYLMVHAGNGWNPLANGGELALLFLAAFLVLATHGAGNKWKLGK